MNELYSFKNLACSFCVIDSEGNHAAEAAGLSFVDSIAGMLSKTWIQHVLDTRLLLQPGGDGSSVFLVLLHAQRQRFDAADNEPGVECAQTGTGGFINQAQLVSKRLLLDYSEACKHIVVTSEIFSTAMDNNVGTERQRLLEVRCQEGVIDNNEKVVLLGNFADSTQVADFHSWVSRGFKEDGLRVGLNSSLDFLQLRSMHSGEFYAISGIDVAEQTEGAAIEVVACDNMVTRCEQIHDSIDSRHA